jgi:alpha-2-macroglobulin
MKNTALASWVVVLAFVLGCGGKAAPKLHVVAQAPGALVEHADAPIRISFDRPVVAPHEVGKALKKLPLKVEPKLALEAHWVDRQTLIATHKEPWKKATRYKVTLEDELDDRLDKSLAFSFVHDPLDVLGTTGVDRDWAPTEPKFALQFDQKVRARDVLAHCTLRADQGGKEVELVAVDKEASDTSIALFTKKPLTQGTSYALSCAKLLPADGDDPLPKDFVTSLRAYPKFALRESSPSDGANIPPDDLTLALTFSTPVDRVELLKHVHITPDHPALHREWLERNQTRNELTASFEADTNYTLRIDAGLRDRFGQKLGAAQEISFFTSDATPSLSFTSGMFAIEADAPGYPLWSRNVEEFALTCAYVPKQNLVKVLTKRIPFDIWFSSGQANDKENALSFEELGLKPIAATLKTGSKKNKWTKTALAFSERCGGKGRGVYLAELRSAAAEAVRKEHGGYLPARVLGNVTNLGLMLKVGLGSGLIWVTSLKDAQPVQGAAVTLYDTEGKKVFSGSSDARGLLMLPGADALLSKGKPKATEVDEEENHAYRSLRLIAVVEKDLDLGVVDGEWSDGIEAWNFNLRTDRSGGALATRGFIESDRGIYRPGETVHFKGLAREVPLNGEPRVPSAKQIALRVEDGAGAELLSKNLSLSEFGGFFADLTLSPEARTGDYYVIAKLGKTTFRETFSVEEFRPVSFEITADKLQENVRLGANNKVSIEARYLFGAPVGEAEVSYQIERRRRWLYFSEYSDYSFEDWSEEEWSPWWEPERYSDFVTEGAGTTDAKGRFSFAFKDENSALTGPQDYLVRASVRDAADQEVTKRLTISAHPSDLYLGVATDSWVAEVDKTFNARIVAVNTQGQPIAAEAKLSVLNVSTHCGEDDGPYAYWHCERKKEPSGEKERVIQIGANAPLTFPITMREPGEHLLVVETKDARGNKVKSSSSVWVTGPGESYWRSDDAHRIGLIPSKRGYAPGETAVLVPEAATDGAAMLVTIERDGILEARVERGAGTAGIQIPITRAHAPNVFVSVALIRGRRGAKDSEGPELKLGMASLPVSFKERALAVQITTEGSDFQPGQSVRGKVRVLGQDGLPVRAEVALSAADEGVLQLIAYKTPDPSDSIYAEWGLGVQSATNWTRLAKLHDAPRDMGEEGADGSGASNDSEARSRFVSSAYWAPALVTDAQGEASFAFEAPDNLTAFRLMAAVADKGGRFGKSEQRIRVRKDLLIAPVVPRFLLADDQIELAAVVHNYTADAGDVEVSFDVEGVTPRKKTMRAKVAANGKAVLRMPVKVLTGETAKYHVAATLLGPAGEARAKDALVLSLPIERAVVKDAESVFAGHGPSAQAALTWPTGLDEKASALELLVDRTGVAELGPSLKYLVQYPYGCLEQTMSRVVPLLKVRELAKSLALRELPAEKIDSYIAFGVDKIVHHQHSDGQFSLWPDSAPYPHLTVYALWGLNEARRSGVHVDKRPFELGLSALKSYASDPARTLAPGDDTGTLAMAAFLMAELDAADPALHARLMTARSALPVYGKAFLLRALRRAKGSATDQALLLTEIAGRVQVKDGVARVDDPIAPEGHYFSSESRSMALVLIALLEAEPSSALIDPLVLGLKKRRVGGRWQSTQENVYGLLALSEFARRKAAGKAEVSLSLGDASLKKTTLSGGGLMRVRLPLSGLTRGATLALSASEPVFYNAVLYKVRPEPVAVALDHGFAVRREYLELESERPITTARVGQLVKVRLRVSASGAQEYVALTDPLPAGFESINSALATERDVSGHEDRPWSWDYRALRDERTDWFVDSLEGGQKTLDYVVRATHVGSFTVPPARAEAMYMESVMGHSASHVLTVTR